MAAVTYTGAENQSQSSKPFHLIYEHARRWELTDRNSIDLVRQRGGRRCIPRVLTPSEIRLLLAQLVEPYHTMVLVAACLGLRASEIMGLQWRDFNWENLTVFIRRGVVNGRSGDTKTEASQRSPPIDPRLARSLQELRERALHQGPQDWVLAKRRWPTTGTTKHPAPQSEAHRIKG